MKFSKDHICCLILSGLATSRSDKQVIIIQTQKHQLEPIKHPHFCQKYFEHEPSRPYWDSHIQCCLSKDNPASNGGFGNGFGIPNSVPVCPAAPSVAVVHIALLEPHLRLLPMINCSHQQSIPGMQKWVLPGSSHTGVDDDLLGVKVVACR